MQQLPWTPWHQVVSLRDDLRTGELSLAEFAADLHDVMMQRGTRPIYEDPAQFFALTFPTFSLRELARDVVLRLAGQNTKAVRQLELTYGGGKTHTLVTLRHLAHDPDALPNLPAVEQFKSHIGAPLAPARVAALAFDKLDVEKGMEVRGPQGELRWLKHPWSVLAFQIAGAAGIRALHAEGLDEERQTPPAEPLLVHLLARPQSEGLATLVLIDEVLMFARGKVAADEVWRGRLVDFFQHLCQAVTKVDRCALIASLLASDPTTSDEVGKKLSGQIAAIFNRQKEEGVQPVQREDVAEVLRRRFFTSESIADTSRFLPHVTTIVNNLAALDDDVRKDRKNAEARFRSGYPFHPDLTDFFYTRWTQLDKFQRTRGILRTFAIALRDAEQWDLAPLVGPNVFLAAPDHAGISEAARELTGIATRELTEGRGHDWSAILEGELAKAQDIQSDQSALQGRELEQAVCTVFLGSQPIGQKAHTQDLVGLLGAARPDRIELEQALRRWTEVSWFLDENEFESGTPIDGGPPPLPKAWRLGNRPNLKQMHYDACTNRVSAEEVEQKLLQDVRATKSLTEGAKSYGVRVHMLPEQSSDIADDGEFHFAILTPKAVSTTREASSMACRFINETTGPDRPRIRRNALVLVAPSADGLDVVQSRVREYLGWLDVQTQLKDQESDAVRDQRLATWTAEARRRIAEAIQQAWSVVVSVSPENKIHAFRVTAGTGPLFVTIKADKRSRIQDSAINAEALLPGGPYDVWREDEPSRRVKDLVNAFAENPKLPKMLRAQEILATIDRGVHDGLFVASLMRPDRSIKTWWRTPIDEPALAEPALEVFLPSRATLSDIAPSVLSPEALPGLWTGASITVSDVVDYFKGGRTVMVPRDGYDEPVDIPACPSERVKEAIQLAVEGGSLWLLNGPSSFQGEALPAGLLTETATLQAPMEPLPVQRLMPDAVADAWVAGETNVTALATALAGQEGNPLPWTVLRQSIDAAITARWLEVVPGSGTWPCDLAAAKEVKLRTPSKTPPPPPGPEVYLGSARLEPNELQDFADALDEIVQAAVGVGLEFRLEIQLGDEARNVPPGTVDKINESIGEICPGLQLRKKRVGR